MTRVSAALRRALFNTRRVKHTIVTADVKLCDGRLCVPMLLRHEVEPFNRYTHKDVVFPISAVGAERLAGLLSGLRVDALSDCVGRDVLLVYRDAAAPVSIVTIDAEGRKTAEIPLTYEVTP